MRIALREIRAYEFFFVSFTFSRTFCVRVRCGSLSHTMVSSPAIIIKSPKKENVRQRQHHRRLQRCTQCTYDTTNKRTNEWANQPTDDLNTALKKAIETVSKSESVWGNALKRFTTANNTNIKFIILLLLCSTFIFIFISIHSLVFHFLCEHIESAKWAHFT